MWNAPPGAAGANALRPLAPEKHRPTQQSISCHHSCNCLECTPVELKFAFELSSVFDGISRPAAAEDRRGKRLWRDATARRHRPTPQCGLISESPASHVRIQIDAICMSTKDRSRHAALNVLRQRDGAGVKQEAASKNRCTGKAPKVGNDIVPQLWSSCGEFDGWGAIGPVAPGARADDRCTTTGRAKSWCNAGQRSTRRAHRAVEMPTGSMLATGVAHSS